MFFKKAIFFITTLPLAGIYPQELNLDFFSADSGKDSIIVAEAGSIKITAEEFLYGYEFGPAFPKKRENSKEVYLNYLINEKLLARDGYAEKYDTLSVVKDNLSELQGDLATEELFKQDILSQVKAPEERLNDAVNKKLSEVEIKWIYAPTMDSLNYYSGRLKKGLSFDSVFAMQLKDSVFADERSWKIDRYKLGARSAEIASVIDTMKPGEISKPVKGADGYYLFKLVNEWKEMTPSESRINELKAEAERSVKQEIMDSLSDVYVKNLLAGEQPVIKGKAFDILRSYLGKFELDEKLFNEWKLKERLDKEFKNFDTSKTDFNKMELVKLKNSSYSIGDFISWYRMRSQYVKLNKENFDAFSSSIEALTWRMVRDRFLTSIAYSRGLQNSPEVQKQLGWWKDKLVYAVERDNIINSAEVKEKTEDNSSNDNKALSDDATKKLLHKILALKQSNKVKINKEALAGIKVSVENNPHAIEFYTVKKGGIFPHPAYPSIDYLWQEWE